jgi:hypothetical protein
LSHQLPSLALLLPWGNPLSDGRCVKPTRPPALPSTHSLATPHQSASLLQFPRHACCPSLHQLHCSCKSSLFTSACPSIPTATLPHLPAAHLVRSYGEHKSDPPTSPSACLPVCVPECHIHPIRHIPCHVILRLRQQIACPSHPHASRLTRSYCGRDSSCLSVCLSVCLIRTRPVSPGRTAAATAAVCLSVSSARVPSHPVVLRLRQQLSVCLSHLHVSRLTRSYCGRDSSSL